MSSRRLVQKGRVNENSSTGQRARQRESVTVQEPTPLPPYEPPSCALTSSAKRALDNLHANHDYSKYKRHIDGSIKALTNSVSDSNERLRLRKEALEKAKNRESKRAQAGDDDEAEAKTLEEHQKQCDGMETNVAGMTAKAERAIRELIDYGDELAMKETIMRAISDNVAAAARRQRRQGSNEDENEENEEPVTEEDEDPTNDGSIISAVELLKKAQQHYAADYAAKSMRARYDTNDYRAFKAAVHNATVGVGGAPVPHARTWFPEDNQNSRTQQDEEESDDEVVIAHASINTKCPLTLQVFKEPYKNEKCNHVFEKSAIVDMIQNHGTVFAHSSQRRGQRPVVGDKQHPCPLPGCDNMIKLDQFYIDTVLLRQIKQAERQAALDAEDDDDDEPALRGTQRGRPADVDDDDNDDDENEYSVDINADRRATIGRIKRERQQSRGPSVAAGTQESSGITEDETVAMYED